MNNKIIFSKNAPEPVGPYPHARKVGSFLYLSGIGPRVIGELNIPGVQLDKNGNLIKYDFSLQCHSVFNNIKIILLDSGAKWDDLIDITIYLTNMKTDCKTFNKIYKKYFIKNEPCRTTIEVLSLPTPIAIELKCIAYLNNGDNNEASD